MPPPVLFIKGRKKCSRCGEKKTARHFTINRRLLSGKSAWCRSCIKKYRLLMFSTYSPKKNEAERNRRKALRSVVLSHYSGGMPRCFCCGIQILEFLGIDHIKGGGRKHKQVVTGHLYEWLKKNGFPEGFRVACHNCNQARGAYGYCPHDN
jgi:hypothetical protein